MRSTAGPSPVLFAAGALFILAFLLALAGQGLRSYFSPDDMMNLYGWWIEPVSKLVRGNLLLGADAYRPMGGVFYSALFAVFGFHPLPFRVACFLILVANLGLLYAVARRLTGSREIGALAALIGCYHSYLFDLYLSTGMVYDILCYFFYFSTFLYYLKLRQARRHPGWAQLAAMVVLTVCALNSKEMAVTLPAALLTYELVYDPPRSWNRRAVVSWLARQGRATVVTGFVVTAFLIVKSTGADPLTANPAYRPVFSRSLFFRMWADYMQQLFLDAERFNAAKLVLLWTLLLVIAWRLGVPALRFCWAFILFSMVPVVFLPLHRAGFVLYIPLAGWAVYAAVVVVAARDSLLRLLRRKPTPAWQVALFLATALALAAVNRHAAPDSHWAWDEQRQVRNLVEALARAHPTLAGRTRILFVDDYLPPDDFLPLFVIRLYYHDPTIQVDRLKQMRKQIGQVTLAGYDYAFRYDGSKLDEIRTRP